LTNNCTGYSAGGSARREGVVGQRALADVVCVLGAKSQQPQYVFGDGVGGSGVVAIGVVAQEFSEPQQRAAGHGEGKFGVVDPKSSGVGAGFDVAQGTRG